MKEILKLVMPLIGRFGFIKYLLLGLLSGLLNFMFIHMITRVVDLVISDGFNGQRNLYLGFFSLLIIAILWTRRTFSMQVINLAQSIFWRLRSEILELLIKAGYQQLVSKKSRIRVSLLEDVHLLTEASINIISFTTSLILTIACIVYLAKISWILSLITIFVSLIGVYSYHAGSKKNNRAFEKARAIENKFIEYLDMILEGFKEIYMERGKGKAIYEKKIKTVSDEAFRNNTIAHVGFLNNQIIGQLLFYILVALILLVLSDLLGVKPTDTVSFIFTLLYLLGSIQTIMVLFPGLIRAQVSAKYLLELKDDLEKVNSPDRLPQQPMQTGAFEKISVRELEFSYDHPDREFHIGPISMDITKGDVIFIYGGNGSGKTTFIFSVLGLCTPSGGSIWLNDQLIDTESCAQYRTNFAVVFSDFYLFNEMYGMEHFDRERWMYFVQLFELEGKVKLEGNSFTTTDLSAGQRKRLALIAALLEEKPLLVLDEWAADQDPYFRRKFYTEIIPLLRDAGYTIIAITHDDRYYHCANKLYKMDFGKLIEENVFLKS